MAIWLAFGPVAEDCRNRSDNKILSRNKPIFIGAGDNGTAIKAAARIEWT